jgi:hypothetical protein
MTADETVAAISERLHAVGFAMSEVQLPSGIITMGFRSEFRIQWLLTKLNLFIAVLSVPEATLDRLNRHVDEVLTYAISEKGRLRGLQNGVAAIPVLVSSIVDNSASELARTKLVRKFAAFAWPVVIDAGTGQSFSHEGRVFVGGGYARWMRKQIHAITGDQ